MVDGSLQTVYFVWHAVTVVGLASLGYWVVFRTELSARYVFGLVTVVCSLWATIEAVAVLASDRQFLIWLQALWSLCAGVSSYLLLVFAAEYTGRHWREQWVVTALGASLLALVPFILTAPAHDLLWQSVEVVEMPFHHLSVSFGPVASIGTGHSVVCMAVTAYYFIDLYFRSRHRPSTALLVIAAGIVVSLLPFVLSQTDIVLIETYDHTTFGIVILTVVFGYTAFQMDWIAVSPVARDQAIENFSDPFLVIKDGGHLADFNPPAERLLENESGDPIGDQVGDVLPELTVFLEGAGGKRDEELVLERNGKRHHFDVSVSPIEGLGGVRHGKQVLLRDISKLREQQKELEQKNQQLEQFSSVVSHDLRNPLSVAQARAQLAADTGEEEHFESLQVSLDRMEAMIQNLLTLARTETNVEELEPVSLSKQVHRSWETAETDGAELVVELPWQFEFEADPHLIQHILENLFRNASDHNESPVTITVGLLKQNDETVGFYVEDDGKGIPADERERVFEHGHTTQDSGSGLGLSIVAEFVDAHGFDICVRRGDEGGARFEIRTGSECCDCSRDHAT